MPRHTVAEMLILLIDLPTGTPSAETVIACSVYRPPASPVSYWENVSTELDSLHSQHNVIVLGDLNVDTLTPSTNLRHLISLCSEFHLANTVNLPTRFPSNTALDAALCSRDLPHHTTQVIAMNGISDHYLVVLSIQYRIHGFSNSHVTRVHKPGLHRLNFAELTSELRTKCNTSLSPDKSLHDNAYALTKCIASVLNHHSPVCNVPVPNSKRPRPQPWVNNTLRTLLQKRKQLHTQARKHPSRLELLQQYRSVRRQGTIMNRQLKSEYFIHQFQEHRHNPKAQWNMTHALSGRIKPRTEAKAPLSELAKTFTSVVTDSSRPQQLPIPSGPQPVLSLGAFCLVPSDTVLKHLQHVNPGKATGSDDIPPVVLKRCSPALSGPLTGIINESLSSGVVPDVFKLTRVCPLFKHGGSRAGI